LLPCSLPYAAVGRTARTEARCSRIGKTNGIFAFCPGGSGVHSLAPTGGHAVRGVAAPAGARRAHGWGSAALLPLGLDTLRTPGYGRIARGDMEATLIANLDCTRSGGVSFSRDIPLLRAYDRHKGLDTR